MADDPIMTKWERVVPIATFLFVVIGGIFFFGGEWRAMSDKIERLITENRDISLDVSAVRQRIEAIEQANARRRSQTADPDTSSSRTPVFEPEWSVQRR